MGVCVRVRGERESLAIRAAQRELISLISHARTCRRSRCCFATTRHTNTKFTGGAAAKIISTSLDALFHNAKINRLTKGALIFHDRIYCRFSTFIPLIFPMQCNADSKALIPMYFSRNTWCAFPLISHSHIHFVFANFHVQTQINNVPFLQIFLKRPST